MQGTQQYTQQYGHKHPQRHAQRHARLYSLRYTWLYAIFLIFLLLPVPGLQLGDTRTYRYSEREGSVSSDIYRDLTQVVTTYSEVSGGDELLNVRFLGFEEGVFLTVPVPRYLLTSDARNETVIADLTVPGYDDILDTSCPEIRQGLAFPFWLGESLDTCLRENMYYHALSPIFRASTFPQNETIAQVVSEFNNTRISVEEELSLQYLTGTFGERSDDTRDLYTYYAVITFVTDDDYVGYSVTAWMFLNRTEVLTSIMSETSPPTTYGRWLTGEAVLYDRSTGWMVLYWGNTTSELIFSGLNSTDSVVSQYLTTEVSIIDRSHGFESIYDFLDQHQINISTYLQHPTSPVASFLSGVPLAVVVVSTGVILYSLRRWRRSRKGVRRELYPEQ